MYLSIAVPARTCQIGADPAELATTVNACSFAEKLHLVDAAQIRSAPSQPRPAR